MTSFTTSWDDGDVLDLRLAVLLEKYGLRGTFYIAKEYRKERLSEAQIQELSRTHEIGAHTLTHPDLRTLSREDKDKEIRGSKVWLEELLGKEIPMFCYPKGYHDPESAQLVMDVGFRAARTTFERGMLQVYPLPIRRGVGVRRMLEPLMERYARLRAMGVPPWRMYSFGAAARAAFDHAYKTGGVFHLWGHSWEIERYGLWGELESLLAYIAAHRDVHFVTNGELYENPDR